MLLILKPAVLKTHVHYDNYIIGINYSVMLQYNIFLLLYILYNIVAVHNVFNLVM